jgi:amino acid transporter
MMPERTGGSPSYAYVAYKDKWPRFAKHVNGFTAWAYWLGWFPVAPLNMILASFYIADKFNLNTTSGVTPIHTFIAYSTIVIAIVGILLVFIPAWLGFRLGAMFATVLGILSMIPLTLLAILPLFKPDSRDFGNLSGFKQIDGTAFFSPLYGHGWLTIYIAFAFLLTWNVIAMEAAACYIGECKNPDRDAPLAMNLSGAYGTFIYTFLPMAVLGVLGVTFIQKSLDPNAILVTTAVRAMGSSVSKIVTGALVIALALSSLNAIMGCARSLYMMALDGQGPRIFGKVNKHNVPNFSMGLNTVLNILLIFVGAPGSIYVLSNVGYVGSFIPVLLGYYFLRRWRPEVFRPFKLPEWAKYGAIALAILYAIVWLIGIPACAIEGCQLGGGKMFLIGVIVVLLYFPLNWWRKAEDRKLGTTDYRPTSVS